MSDSKYKPKIQCKSCVEDIFANSRVAIRCVECDDLDLCPDCFSSRVKLGSHEPTHAYKLLDNSGFRLFQTDWSASEHLKLLEAIEQYGYGNWEDISRELNAPNEQSSNWKYRSASDIKDEYCNIFLHSSIGRQTWKEEERGRARDHTQINPLLPPVQHNEPPPNLTVNEAIMLGYLPKRDDFELEYDNDAEMLVSQLEDESNMSTGSNSSVGINGNGQNTSEEDELAVSLKISHVDAYKLKLRERERRKRVAREHQLVSQYFKDNPIDRKYLQGQKPAKKSSRDPVTERLKVLAEFQGVKEHQNFMASIVKEKDIKSRIKDIIRFRKNGITRLSDSQEFEVQRVRRNNRKKNEKRRMQQNTILGEAAAELNLSLAQSPLSIKSEELSNCGSAAQSPAQQIASPAKLDEKPSITGLPGYEVLSANEKKLCANLRLTPAHYISYKTCLLTNHLQKKKGQTPKPLNPAGLDKNNRKIIFNFLMRAGWITAY